MARAKKEAALTPEERLQAALVPDWEWPYKLPENWCWTTVGTICDGFQYGYTEKATFEKIGPHFIRITDIGDGIINDSGAPYCKIDSDSFIKYKINKDDILIARMGSVGENGLATHNIDGVFASYLIRIVPRSNAKYVCNFLQTNLYWGQISEKAQGTTRLNVNANVLKNLIIPLPPLAEQQRIVDRIESMFSKLDEAKEKAQAVVDSFETRKAAILHKAFTGELTAKWREEHGVGMESWEKFKFNELGTLERGRSKHRPRNDPKLFGGKYPFIQTGDVARSGMYITEHTQTLSELGAEQSKLFPKGTLCITIAANIGDVSILTYDCCFPDSVVGFTPNERTLSEYIYYLMSTLQREIEVNAPATAQKNINLRILNDLLLDIPSVAEQTQIVNQVEYLFFQEQHTKETAEIVLNQIDLMKKSILARAFRGELGTNDLSEESAVELLKRTIL